jgi:hypothetical protein
MTLPKRLRWPIACWCLKRAASRTISNVDIARPRQRGSAQLAALEGSILRDLLSGEHRKEE